jgi:biotin operon repressor
MKKQICKDCGKPICKDEVALYKKIIEIRAKEFLCLECMSEVLDCTVEDLEIKIDEFKEQGCTLFI